jgi:hypothetical protein
MMSFLVAFSDEMLTSLKTLVGVQGSFRNGLTQLPYSTL